MLTRNRPGMLKTVLWTLLVTVAVALGALLTAPFTGAIDVAATTSHLPGVGWYLEETQERSVASRAQSIEVPADLAAPRRIERGLVAYHQMCVRCHGAPGLEPSWLGKGLNPAPPRLEVERELGNGSAARDFWVIENGIRMTGMAALGPTHDDQEMWDLVAFLQHLPKMTPEAYASEVETAGLELEPEEHHHS